MKTFTWFLLFLLALLGASGYYIYRYVYLPKNLMLVRLNRENLKLKYEIRDEMNAVYRECEKKSSTGPIVSEDTISSSENNNDTIYRYIEPLVFSFSIKDLFKNSRLTTKGKAIIKEFYSQIKDRQFDSVRIVINRRNPRAARKVLNIKRYLVSLGLKKDKVWARLSKDVPKDSVIFRLIW